MILTYDTAKLDDADLYDLANVEYGRYNRLMHLSGAVPAEHVAQIERDADVHFRTGKAIRDELNARVLARKERTEMFLARARARNAAPVARGNGRMGGVFVDDI